MWPDIEICNLDIHELMGCSRSMYAICLKAFPPLIFSRCEEEFQIKLTFLVLSETCHEQLNRSAINLIILEGISQYHRIVLIGLLGLIGQELSVSEEKEP